MSLRRGSGLGRRARPGRYRSGSRTGRARGRRMTQRRSQSFPSGCVPRVDGAGIVLTCLVRSHEPLRPSRPVACSGLRRIFGSAYSPTRRARHPPRQTPAPHQNQRRRMGRRCHRRPCPVCMQSAVVPGLDLRRELPSNARTDILHFADDAFAILAVHVELGHLRAAVGALQK